jgi:hypothetical protein
VPKYHVTASITGKAMLEITAPSADAARHAAIEMTLSDVALTGRSDILSFKIIPGEVTRVVMDDDDLTEEEEQPKKPRPSGWYRPRYD